MGKDYSRGRKLSDRPAGDFYQTPHCLVREFVSSHVWGEWGQPNDIGHEIADLCDGYGAITRVLKEIGYDVIGEDILLGNKDFFKNNSFYNYGIMNPPFRLFNEWVRHSFKLFVKSFALLGPTTYLQGVDRFNNKNTGIFQNRAFPLTHVYTFNRYPMLGIELREDGLLETGMQAFSWFVWTRIHGGVTSRTETIHRWIDIDRWVYRKGRPKYGGK